MTSELTISRPTYARAHDYFGVWAMEDSGFNGLLAMIAQSDLDAHIEAASMERVRRHKMSPAERAEFDKQQLAIEAAELSELFGIEFAATDSGLMVGKNGLAVIPLAGTLMKAQSSFGAGTSTVDARRKIRAAMSDPAVSAALLRIDSPGGTVAGTQEFADDVAKLQSMKPTASQIEDLGASAAYWPAAQTGLIGMNSAGMAGSIGVLNVVTDSSGRAADMKVKVHRIATGKHKGIGVPGAEVTVEHLTHLQERTTALHNLFANAVAKGRKMTPEAVAEVADGSVFVGQKAKDVGLVDAIQSMDDTVSQLMERVKPKTQVSVLKGLEEMPEPTAEEKEKTVPPKAATLAELKEKFPKSTAEWRESQMIAGATVADASLAFNDFLQAQLDAREEELIEAKKKKNGVDPFADDGSSSEAVADASGEFMKARSEYMAKHNVGSIQAAAAVAKSHPELHAAYVAGTQITKGATRSVVEQYEGLKK